MSALETLNVDMYGSPFPGTYIVQTERNADRKTIYGREKQRSYFNDCRSEILCRMGGQDSWESD